MKRYNPTSAGVRFKTTADFSDITKTRPEKSLTETLVRHSGRNNMGHVTVRFRGAGHKRRYRIVDFKRARLDVPATVLAIEYDPNRTARIALVQYADGEKAYVVAHSSIKVGDQLLSSKKAADFVDGHTYPLSEIPVGSNVFNIEIKPGAGAKMVRSAGSVAQLMAKENDYALIKLPSGEIRKILLTCQATMGSVGNADHENIQIGKAGRKRWMGRKGHVRGTVMNPVDHPHGGGHGRDHGGRHPVSPTGVPCKGYKTRQNKRTNKFIIKDRREARQ